MPAYKIYAGNKPQCYARFQERKLDTHSNLWGKNLG